MLTDKVLCDSDRVLTCLEVREEEDLIIFDDVGTKYFVALFVEKVYDVLVVHVAQLETHKAEFVVLRKDYLNFCTVIVVAVDVLEFAVRNLEEVLIARKKRLCRSDDEFSEVQTVLLDCVLADLLLLSWVKITECK